MSSVFLTINLTVKVLMDILSFSISEIVTFILVLARVGGIFTSGPIFSNSNVSPIVRITIAVSLSFVFLPMAHYDASHIDILPFILVIIKETLVGLVMGFLASLLFAAVQMAGGFIDLQIGFGFGNMVDPMQKEHSAVIGQFYNMCAILLFLIMNGHHMMIRGLADSFAVLPLGKMAISPDAAGGIMQTFATIFVASLKIGAPVVGAIFLTDVALGVLSRTVPQLNVLVVGMPAKMAVGFFVISAVLPFIFAVMMGLFSGLYGDLMAILRHMGGI